MLFDKPMLGLLSIASVVAALPTSPSVRRAPDTKAVKREPGVGVDVGTNARGLEWSNFNRRQRVSIIYSVCCLLLMHFL